jgi:hypothetical protein
VLFSVFQDKLVAVFGSYVGDFDSAFYGRTADILVLAYACRMAFDGLDPLSYDSFREVGSFYRA